MLGIGKIPFRCGRWRTRRGVRLAFERNVYVMTHQRCCFHSNSRSCFACEKGKSIMCSKAAAPVSNGKHTAEYASDRIDGCGTSRSGRHALRMTSANTVMQPVAPIVAAASATASADVLDDANCDPGRGGELDASSDKGSEGVTSNSFQATLGAAAAISSVSPQRGSDADGVGLGSGGLSSRTGQIDDDALHAGSLAHFSPISRSMNGVDAVLTRSSCHRYDVGRFIDAVTCSLDTEERVEDVFEHSARLRTISNAQVCKYIKFVSPAQVCFVHAAMRGAVNGGLRLNKLTYETAIHVFVRDGYLRPGMALYQEMIRLRMTPTARTYVNLMQITLDGNMPSACQSLFHEMQKRGVRPMAQNYALMITSFSYDAPPNVDEAIRLFDKISRNHREMVTLPVYNGLMMVYLKMQPFDWRVVYNCYYELRTRLPRIPLEWSSYDLVAEAMRRGRVDYVRRAITFADAWANITQPWSREYVRGGIVFATVAFAVKFVLGLMFCAVYAFIVHPRITSMTDMDEPYM